MSTKLPIIKVKILEKVLLTLWALKRNAKVVAMFSIGILMEGIQLCPIMETRMLVGP